jgi:hypothetical protein
MKDVIIESNQFKIVDGSFVYTKSDLEFALQSVKQILQTVLGEDPQDTTKGLDLQGVIFNEFSSSSDLYAEVLRNVLKVDGIEEVINIELTQEKEELKATVEFIYNGELIEAGVTIDE